jgi:hypothetical protein
MTRDSRTLAGPRHRRTIFIVVLIALGVCLFAMTAWLSLHEPLAIEDESGLSEGLYNAS